MNQYRIPRSLGFWGTVLVLLIGPVPDVVAQEQTGSVTGQVVNANGEPAVDAEVRLLSMRQVVKVGEDGGFSFEAVPAGNHLIEAISLRGGQGVERVTVMAGEVAQVRIELERLFHGAEIVVTAGPRALMSSELAQAASVIGARELAQRASTNLGETLDGEPGVTSSYFGPGSGRPVIRGLSGDRVRILEGGVGVGDASNTSPDHGVSVDPLSLNRIEIIRGPATLLYGSSAMGGVVNVFDNKIARELPTETLTGNVVSSGGTVANEGVVSAELNARVGNVVLHVSGLRRDTDDFEIPGFADLHAEEGEHDEGEEGEHEEEEEPFGILENSFVQTTRVGTGVSLVGENGYLGVAWSGYNSFYGVPGHGHVEEGEHDEGEEGEHEEEEEAGGFIDLQQRRVDTEGSWRFGSGLLSSIKARFGLTNYVHNELEGDEVGSTVENDEWETRIEAQHRSIGPFSGVLGFQFGNRDFSAFGEEAFVSPNFTDRFALFLFEEAGEGPVRVQGGIRFETQDAGLDSGGGSRDQSGVSASLGLNWRADEQLSFSLSGARNVKLPTAEELFSDGPHLATRQFEVGDVSLDEEVGYSLDLGARVDHGRFNGELTFFTNTFNDFIFQEATDDEEDGLPVLLYSQADANFVGLEWLLGYELLSRADQHVHLEFTGDWVRAELSDTDEPLPRIPPLRLGSALNYESPSWTGRVGIRGVTEQDRVSQFEEPTDGYTLLEAQVGYRLFFGGSVHELILKGTNLTDEDARSHVSFLKELAPLPGRDIRLMYRLTF